MGSAGDGVKNSQECRRDERGRRYRALGFPSGDIVDINDVAARPVPLCEDWILDRRAGRPRRVAAETASKKTPAATSTKIS
jgi:hypothetical protein